MGLSTSNVWRRLTAQRVHFATDFSSRGGSTEKKPGLQRVGVLSSKRRRVGSDGPLARRRVQARMGAEAGPSPRGSVAAAESDRTPSAAVAFAWIHAVTDEYVFGSSMSNRRGGVIQSSGEMPSRSPGAR